MLDRMREWLGRGRPEFVSGFTPEQAIEAFKKTRDTAGDREGVVFAEGQRFEPTTYLPGTVFRETRMDEKYGEGYCWWCVGNNDGKWLSLFLAVSQGGVYVQPSLVDVDAELRVSIKTVPLDKNGKLIIVPGEDGIIIDQHLHSDPRFKGTPMLDYKNHRQTIEVRVYQLGVKQKEPVKQRGNLRLRQRDWVQEAR